LGELDLVPSGRALLHDLDGSPGQVSVHSYKEWRKLFGKHAKIVDGAYSTDSRTLMLPRRTMRELQHRNLMTRIGAVDVVAHEAIHMRQFVRRSPFGLDLDRFLLDDLRRVRAAASAFVRPGSDVGRRQAARDAMDGVTLRHEFEAYAGSRQITDELLALHGVYPRADRPTIDLAWLLNEHRPYAAQALQAREGIGTRLAIQASIAGALTAGSVIGVRKLRD
jgi:hypothetical protein